MATGKKFLSLLLLAALIQVAQAATLEGFVSPYLYPGENYSADASATQIRAGTGTFVLVQVRNADAFFLRRTLSSENETLYFFVNDTAAIYSALYEHLNTTTYPNASGLDGIITSISGLNASRFPEENECKRAVGLDRPGATCAVDRCESCMSVPYCSDKMPYFGEDFARSIHQFDVDSTGIDAALNGAAGAAGALKAGGVDASQYLGFIVSNLTRAGAYADSLGGSHLFGCAALSAGQSPPMGLEWCAYREGSRAESQWCREIRFNRTYLLDASAKAAVLQGRAVTNASLQSRSQGLYSAMNTRVNALQLRTENETFQAFFLNVSQRAGNVTAAANMALAKVSDQELTADLAIVSEILLRTSQYGLARNYTAANATSAQLFVLADKVEARTQNLSSQYSSMLELNDSASLSIFKARLYLEPQDRALSVRLATYEEGKEAVDEALLSGEPLSMDALNDFKSDLGTLGLKADSIAQEKQGQRAIQASSWIADLARMASGAGIDGFSAFIPLSPEQKESYARTLPTIIVILGGLMVYFACASLFFVFVYAKKIRMHRVAIFLWAIIFAFLFVLVGISVVTANSVIQQQAARSTFGLFYGKLASATNASVVINTEGVGADVASAMRSCSAAMAGNLTALNKTVQAYEINGANCIVGDTVIAPSECAKNFGSVPTFMLNYGNETKATFYVYYIKEAMLSGGEDYYSTCMIARAFGNS